MPNARGLLVAFPRPWFLQPLVFGFAIRQPARAEAPVEPPVAPAAPRARAPRVAVPPASERPRVHRAPELRLPGPAGPALHVPERRGNAILRGLDRNNILLDNMVYFGRLRPRDRR